MSMLRRWRQRLHEVLEAGHSEDQLSRLVDFCIILLILLNVFAFTLQTVDSINQVYGKYLERFNVFSVIIFTIEYLCRLWVCIEIPPLRHLSHLKARLKFMRSPLLLIDLIAILPFYLGIFINLDLRVLRAFRLVRFFKLARYSPALQTLGRVFSGERKALLGALIIMIALLLTASTIMYFLERNVQPDVFSSVPAAAWWAVATLTTVGYGDIIPATVVGKLFGGLMMIFGLGMFALPIGIVATGFTREINRREFVVTWSMVAKVPLFSHLDARSIAQLMSGLQSQTFPAGSIILHQSEIVNAIYFIATGEVRLDTGTEVLQLSEGDYFGDTTLDEIDNHDRFTATAVSSCDLLVLERHDFNKLLRRNLALKEQIKIAVKKRQNSD